MEDNEVVDVVSTNERGVHGYGRMCTLKTPVTMKEMMDKVKSVFGAKGLKYTGSLDDKVQKLAINTGSGAGILKQCINAGCDTFITGDVKYNGYRDALDMGMNIYLFITIQNPIFIIPKLHSDNLCKHRRNDSVLILIGTTFAGKYIDIIFCNTDSPCELYFCDVLFFNYFI